MAGVTRAATLGWTGLLAARDVPPVLRTPARIARVSGLLFVAALAGWIATLFLATADRQGPVVVAALAMGFVGALHSFAGVVLLVRALRVVGKRACLGCGHALAQGDPRSEADPPRSAVCTECGRADDGTPTSPTVRDVWPGARGRIEGVDTPVTKFLPVIAVLVWLFAALSILPVRFPRVPFLDAEGRVSSQLVLGVVLFAFNATPVARTLCAMRAARSCPPA